jgi:hypothetical protein
MFKNNISYGSDANGFVSLKSGARDVSFPALITQSGDNKFHFSAVGKVTASIQTCFAEKILYENQNLLHVRKPKEFFLTDGNWDKGIARQWAGFFTHNTEKNRSSFAFGKQVIFPNGDKRIITSVSENGPYLNVWVDGKILDSTDVGFPDKFEVAE